jgi:phage baseplate assembly protein W
MPFGDIRLNMLFDNGICRCHGQLSPQRTASGDIARVTDEKGGMEQRLGIWLACKKGERPLHPQFGCCIWEFILEPMTIANLKRLKGQVQYELEELFPEYVVSNTRITVPARNTINVTSQIGPYPVEFMGNPATLGKLNTMLRSALSDLGMTRS